MKTNLKTVLIAVASSAATYGILFWTLPKQQNPWSAPDHNLVTQVAYNQPIAPTEFTTAAEKTIHAVVHVKNVAQSKNSPSLMEFFYGFKFQEAPQVGTGSGVIISPDGFIVTNHHVVASAQNLEVTLNNNQTYTAQLVGSDQNSDIALLKIEPGEPLTYLTFGDSDQTQIGEWVLAVGNPFNLTSTVTAGIISAKARDLGKNQSFIQTDAAVNPGNSGGALVNIRGELIGINTAITSQTGSYIGYSFAVPSNIARKVIADIMEFGNVQNGILGVMGGELNGKNAEDLGVNETEGFFISEVQKASGAYNAGLKSGDIIKKINETNITKFADLKGFLSTKRPNDVVNVTILRDSKITIIPVTLYKNMTVNIAVIGTLKKPTKEELKEYNLDYGLVISNLNSRYKGDWIADGVNQGSLVTTINGEKLKTVEQVEQLLEKRSEYEPMRIEIIKENGEKVNYRFK